MIRLRVKRGNGRVFAVSVNNVLETWAGNVISYVYVVTFWDEA
jgi:hypothetical protein